jgi:hypothetical protein
MRSWLFRWAVVAGILACLGSGLSCAHDQELQSIEVQPTTETFGASNIPINLDAGLAVQLRALGHYIHPPVTKDITNQVTWSSNDVQMFTINSTGLLTATGNVCGGALVSATVQTNSSVGGQGSSGAIVTGTMSANVTCFTGASTSVVLTITFLGSGKGTVTVLPSGFICSATCGIPFAPGAGPITVTAAAGGTFGGWTNCPSATGTVCTISSITNNMDIDATFN